MGYYTKFKLTIPDNEAGKQIVGFLEFKDLKGKSLTELKRRIGSIDTYFEEMEALEEKLGKACKKAASKGMSSSTFFSYDPTGEGVLEMVRGAWLENLDECKWYEHETDLKVFSSLFPDVLFTLRGEGEEAEDIWVKYFQNGKLQTAKAQITFEPFDPKKLK